MPLATSPWAKQRRESDINSGHVCKTLTTYCYFPTYPHFQMQQSLQTGMGSLVRSFIHICKYIFVMPDVILYRKCSTTVFLLSLSFPYIDSYPISPLPLPSLPPYVDFCQFSLYIHLGFLPQFSGVSSVLSAWTSMAPPPISFLHYQTEALGSGCKAK